MQIQQMTRSVTGEEAAAQSLTVSSSWTVFIIQEASNSASLAGTSQPALSPPAGGCFQVYPTPESWFTASNKNTTETAENHMWLKNAQKRVL